MFSFDTLDALSCNNAVSDAPCPSCGPSCKAAVNQRRKVLRIWHDGDFITYTCARCGESGYAKRAGVAAVSRPKPVHVATIAESDKTDLAAYLWRQSVPMAGTIAETYLSGRGCLVQSESLRFLPERGEHPAAMIARFGTGLVTGVHLTKLKPDGSGKAGTEKDKIMIGPSKGQPIVIADNLDREELIIAEGIEDTASLVSVMGWSAWAAGSAGRIPHLVAAAHSGYRIYLAVDDDKAGRAALEASRKVRPDLVPVNLTRILSYSVKTDANAAKRKFGSDAIIAAVEWSDAQARYAQGEICFEQMQRASSYAQEVFRKLSEEAEAA